MYVLSQLLGRHVDSSSGVIARGYMGNNTHTAGCLINTNKVFSICTGIVLAVDTDPFNDTITVTVENNSSRWIRYCMLSSANVKVGQTLKISDLIGVGTKSTIQLEYCTSETSKFPVRYLSKQLYKHDPTPVIFGMINLSEAV